MLELVIDNTPAHTSEAWRAKGRCRDLVGTLTPLFFSEDFYEIARAKAICSSCPVMSECFEAAKSQHEPWGVWGGELFENGRVCRDKRPRGRPPTQARPQLIVEEVPLPPDLVRA
ncbi:WhiB family transcriptional regulator [Candidatus Poriferisodalis sp.]|uniref:WhiB family transcriptional regulator n=1 Tax=Candidatus Poriferisodalis sp. TaxID=3101277 RepID=UPI003B017E5A